MISWIFGFNMKDRKKKTELRELLGLEPMSVVIRSCRLRWLDIMNVTMILIG